MYKNVRKGYFIPKNPKKYAGNAKNIIYRSNLERRFFKIFDENPDIVTWGSEEFYIPYTSPIDKRSHRYFVDIIIKTSKGEVWVIEIKPYSQTMEPKLSGKTKKTALTEGVTWIINSAKWQAAREYCKQRGWRFVVMTERDLKSVKS